MIFRPPLVARQSENYIEKCISYAAKKLTIYPGKSAVIADNMAYGCILHRGMAK